MWLLPADFQQVLNHGSHLFLLPSRKHCGQLKDENVARFDVTYYAKETRSCPTSGLHISLEKENWDEPCTSEPDRDLYSNLAL